MTDDALRNYQQAVALDWSVSECITDVVSDAVLAVISSEEVSEIERRVMRHFRDALLSDAAVEAAMIDIFGDEPLRPDTRKDWEIVVSSAVTAALDVAIGRDKQP